MPAFIPIGGGPVGSPSMPSNPFMIGSGVASPGGSGRLTLASNGRRELAAFTVNGESRLLRWLYNRFDKEPHATLALQLGYDGRMVWAVTDDRRLVTDVLGGSGAPLDITLANFATIAALANHLAVQPGYSVPFLAGSDVAQLAPFALLRASANIGDTNGRNLYSFTSALWGVLETLAVELDAIAAQIPRLAEEMATTTADGDFLDTLGSYYGIPRLQAEGDSAYGPRIIAEVLRPKCNNKAIELAIEVFTGQQCTVTDVQVFTATAPLYNSAYNYNAAITHIGISAATKYNLFDAVYAYDLLNGPSDVSSFAAVVRGVVNRIRAAGTHLRSLALSGSSLSDDAPAAADALAPRVSWSVSEAGPATVDGDGVMTVAYRPRYDATRHYDGSASHNFGLDELQRLDGTAYP